VSHEARAQLDRWSDKARRLFDELLEDAASDLQRELLQRAVAAAHTPAEVHAFADELRALSDPEAYEACTLGSAAPEDYTVAQLLRAEADPLFAFELKGGSLDPNEEEDAFLSPHAPARSAGLVASDVLAEGLARPKKRAFEAASPDLTVAPRDRGGLGEAPAPSHRAPGRSPPDTLLVDLVTEATRGLSVTWREYDVDTEGGLALREALASAASALTRGIPVPCAIGPSTGQHRRFVLLLQTSTSGKTRAWQLYDPSSHELVWANEGDLLAKTELPFANKVNRLLTRIVLPQNLRAVS
jgi:hypothetical protein